MKATKMMLRSASKEVNVNANNQYMKSNISNLCKNK